MADAKAALSQSLSKAQGNTSMASMKQSDVSSMLLKYKGAISQALPKHLTAERIIQIASTVVARNPKLSECSASSLIGAVMQASILGLKPVSELGHCYFVPYGGQVQFQIGYRGYLELARRSGEILTVYAQVVREGDTFSYSYGLKPDIVHIPAQGSSGEVTHAYAVVHYKTGGYNFEVVTREEIEGYRRRNKMQGVQPSGAWATDYAAMSKKTALRRLSPYLPLETDASYSDDKVVEVNGFGQDQSGVLYEVKDDVVEEAVNKETGEILTAEVEEVAAEGVLPGMAIPKQSTKRNPAMEQNAIYE